MQKGITYGLLHSNPKHETIPTPNKKLNHT
jgi:hypothetical protein